MLEFKLSWTWSGGISITNVQYLKQHFSAKSCRVGVEEGRVAWMSRQGTLSEEGGNNTIALAVTVWGTSSKEEVPVWSSLKPLRCLVGLVANHRTIERLLLAFITSIKIAVEETIGESRGTLFLPVVLMVTDGCLAERWCFLTPLRKC